MTGPVVNVEQGRLQGTVRNGHNGQKFYSFQGIPYAEPPVGELRFKAPKPAKPWKGVLQATEDKDECYSTHMIFHQRVGSEDCLHLNVHTPNIPQNKDLHLLPVMVWIHGGGFTSGSSKYEVYGPEYLIYHDVVFVSINYRLGCLGFLSLDDPSLEVPGNAGIKDQILALQWVQKNIAAFGGDPKNVTIHGESAGAASVHLLVLSPAARGLFHRAIMQSGCALNYWARGWKSAKQVAKNLGFESEDERQILKFLREVPVEKLVDGQEAISDEFPKSTPRPTCPVIEKFSPNVQNVITEEPIDIIRSGNYSKVPILMGYNDLEGMMAEIVNGDKLKANFDNQVPYELNLDEGSKEFKQVARRIKKFYYGDAEPTRENINNFLKLATDSVFVHGIQSAVKAHIATSTTPLYLYRFSVDGHFNLYKNSSGLDRPGACHADELGYLFKTLAHPDDLEGDLEIATIERMTKLWTNFAKFGDPNPKDRIEGIDVVWEPVKSDKELKFLEIGEKLATGVNPDAERMAFWDSIYNLKGAVSKL